MTFLLVGLGNPGPKYSRHRHNVGFMVVDELARLHNLSWQDKGHKALEARSGSIGSGSTEESFVLFKPQTFMNQSGVAVASWVHFFNLSLHNTVLIHDDLDLPLGRIRWVETGSSGGQNGVASVHQHLGTKSIPRLKIGIGRPAPPQDVASYVLSPFSADQTKFLPEILDLAVKSTLCYLKEGIKAAMNQFNGRRVMIL